MNNIYLMDTWNSNASTIWSIITDYLQEQNITIDLKELTAEYNVILYKYFKKRFDYDIEEINKFILFDIHKYIELKTEQINENPNENISDINNTQFIEPHNENILYTNEELREKKLQETQELYNLKKNDFDSYSNKKIPNKISFEDNVEDINENIDDIYKRALESRNYDIQTINSDDKKKAEEWINNGVKNNAIDKKQSINNENTNTNKETIQSDENLSNDTKKSFIKSLKNKLKNNEKNNNNKKQFDNSIEPKKTENDDVERKYETINAKNSNETYNNTELLLTEILDLLKKIERKL